MRQQAVKQACEQNSMDVALAALRQSIARWTDKEGLLVTAIPGVSLARRDAPTQPMSSLYEPSICVIAQGVKRVLLGNDTYVFDSHQFLLTAVDLPTVVQILHASREQPYLSLLVQLDPRELAQLMADSHLPQPQAQPASRGMATGAVTVLLLSACQRLLDLLAAPQDIPILAPLIQQEILYRLLVGEQGARLRQVASAGSPSQQIAQAIAWLKRHYTRPLRIEDLAAHVHMSPSTFHQHFRTLTAMSPLQYQKWLRLNEARRLMLMERLDAATAAFEVGYESPSQFSREYRRVFGASPWRDITSLRQLATSERV
jgi:AraC-like DNA-binding protein